MNTQHSRSRREFLSKLTSAAGGGAVLAATSGMVQAAPETPEQSSQDKPKSKGYQHTEHVETYYRLADF